MNKKETICIIRSLLTSKNSPYSVCSLNKDFKKETGIDIPLHGYNSLNDFLHSIPDTVKLTGVYPIQQVHLVAHEKSAHIVLLVQKQKKSLKKPKKNTNFVPKKSIYLKPNEVTKSHVSTTLSRVKSFSPSKKFSNLVIKEPKLSEICNTSSLNNVMNNILKKDVLDPGEKILPLDLNSHAKIGEYVEVCTASVCHPHKFYLYLRKFRKKMLHLFKKMTKFYLDHNDAFEIPEEAVKPGLTCVAFYEIDPNCGLWLRAEVCRILNLKEAVINLVDLGSNIKIEKKKLKFLHRNFSFLPKQAFLACLANVKPPKGLTKWTDCAKKRFSDLVIGRDLIAGVVNIINEVPWMNVALTFTSDAEIHINDTLVTENLAAFQLNVQKNSEYSLKVEGFLNRFPFLNKVILPDTVMPLSNKNSQVVNHHNPILYSSKNEKLKQMFKYELS